jgi:hypothetical protein
VTDFIGVRPYHRAMTPDELAAILARQRERERFISPRSMPTGLDPLEIVAEAYADVERLLAERGPAGAGVCPFCGDPGAALVEDLNGFLVLCSPCGGRGPSRKTEAEAWEGWNRLALVCLDRSCSHISRSGSMIMRPRFDAADDLSGRHTRRRRRRAAEGL